MPVKELWIDAKEAAAILTTNSGHPVSSDYVRLLSTQGKIRSRARDGRTKEYNKMDVDRYTVEGRGKHRTSTEPTEREKRLQRKAARKAEEPAA